MGNIKAIKGTYDILPEDTEGYWQYIEEVVREVMRLYGYSEIRTPIFEDTALFKRSIGEDTDIVGKEMYMFTDMGNRSITLRPEGTASVVRSFNEHHLDQKGLPQKLWYMGPMFRQERPQKGRQRQFHQFGVEVIGSSSPMLDAEVMILFDAIAGKLGLDGRKYLINSLGGQESRVAFRAALVNFLDTVESSLCEDCRRRKVSNPLRVLDCKVPQCHEVLDNAKELPRTIDYLTVADREHFETVQSYLKKFGIGFEIDYSLVRGLDYYTGTVFEMNDAGLGAQSAVMAGGRYDNLVSELGGKNLPAVGFACGIERLIMAVKDIIPDTKNLRKVDVFVIYPGLDLRDKAMECCFELRKAGYSADMDYLDKSMKAQMKTTSKLGVKYAIIVEPDKGVVSVRNMDESKQEKVLFSEFIDKLRNENSNI
ncbi:histidine--tRNA ligase [Candidatus Latescibacterota bacterium]